MRDPCLIALLTAVVLWPMPRAFAGSPGPGQAEGVSSSEARGRTPQRRNRHRRGVRNEDVRLTVTPEEERAIALETQVAVTRPVDRRLSAMGKVLAHPRKQAVVGYPFSARVAEVHVAMGDWVEKGEKVLTLLSEEAASTWTALLHARADHELALINQERQARLFEKGVGARKELRSSEAALDLARAHLRAAEKKLSLLGFSETDVEASRDEQRIDPVVTLLAPIAGKVIAVDAVLGAMIDQDSELVVVMDAREVVVDAQVFERDIGRVGVDQEVEVAVPALSGRRFSGRVRYVGDVVDDETRTVTVRTIVPNRDLVLKPGMFADVSIVTDNRTHSVTVPASAVLDDNDTRIVFVKLDGVYLARSVETGSESDGQVEVLAGLADGDVVVTRGSYQLKSKLYENLLDVAPGH